MGRLGIVGIWQSRLDVAFHPARVSWYLFQIESTATADLQVVTSFGPINDFFTADFWWPPFGGSGWFTTWRSWSTKVHMLYEVTLFIWPWYLENDRSDWPGVYFYPRNSAKFSCPIPWHCCFARNISARKSASERPRSQRCILHPILLVLVPWESSGKEERWAALDRKVDGMGDHEMIHLNMIWSMYIIM